MASYDVIVTWMDGTQETYFATEHPHLASDGVLLITERFGVTHAVKQQWNIPLANVRIWKAEQR